MTAEELHETLGQPTREVSYAKDGVSRLGAHYRHLSSDYLLNLFEAIAAILWPDKFEVVRHIIHMMWEVRGSSLVEKLFIVPASAYIKSRLLKFTTMIQRYVFQHKRAFYAHGCQTWLIKTLRCSRLASIGQMVVRMDAFAERMAAVAGGYA